MIKPSVKKLVEYKMRKLEDISKKQIFTTPEGYFDHLPNKIQARISSKRTAGEYRLQIVSKLRYAIPLVILLVIVFLWINKSYNAADPESLLATVQTEDLIAYLNDAELTTDDLIQAVDFNIDDLNDVEEEVYQLNINDDDFIKAIEVD